MMQKESMDEIYFNTLVNMFNVLEKRVKKCEEITQSNEFIEYRNLISKTNKFIDGNKICGIDDYKFPKLKGISDKQVYVAKKYREKFVIANMERFEELTKVLNYEKRFNWKLLHKMRVTPQEYVILFSPNAGDIYGMGIDNCFDDNYEYISGSCDKYEYDN